MECSAATGDNVIQSLEAVARYDVSSSLLCAPPPPTAAAPVSRLLSQNPVRGQETLVLHKESRQKRASRCC